MPFKDPVVRKEKQAGYSKTYYEKNRKLVISKVNKTKKENRAWFVNYKKQLVCVTCGESHPAALDFHHINPCKSDRKVHELVGSGYTKKRILEEIEKCVVLCSNCHRVHHHDERELKKKKILAKKQK